MYFLLKFGILHNFLILAYFRVRRHLVYRSRLPIFHDHRLLMKDAQVHDDEEIARLKVFAVAVNEGTQQLGSGIGVTGVNGRKGFQDFQRLFGYVRVCYVLNYKKTHFLK